MSEDAPGPDEAPQARVRSSGVDPRVLELLICPLTRLPLKYVAADNELIARKAQLAYPIRHGLPLLTESDARQIEESGEGA